MFPFLSKETHSQIYKYSFLFIMAVCITWYLDKKKFLAVFLFWLILELAGPIFKGLSLAVNYIILG